MSRDTTIGRGMPGKSSAASQAGRGSEKTGPPLQAARRAEGYHDRVEQRAYELYEQRGRQDGGDMEDWLDAEREVDSAPTASR